MTTTSHEITLGNKVVTLEVNAKTMARIGAYFDGFVPATRKVMDLDLGAFRRIIAAGTNKPVADDDGIDDAIFATGVMEVQEPLFKYLDLLITGGRGSPKPDAQ